MKPPVAILAGGKGTRLSEETVVKPKPMVEIGGKPMLWHIMKIYATYGYTRFIIALGYKGDMIREYFSFRSGDWEVTCLDTGEETQISGRVRRILQHTGETTMLTYGDGLADIDVDKLLEFHRFNKTLATVTAVRPPSRFGRLQFHSSSNLVSAFDEKPVDGEYINGGFFVLEPDILDWGRYGDDEIFERVYLPKLAEARQLAGYIHTGFWQCMDTIREKELLNKMWEKGDAKWKIWK